MPTKHDVASEAKDTAVTPETPRSAFEKRERASVLQEILQDSPESNDIALQDEINTIEDDGANATSARMVSKATQTDGLAPTSVSRSTQTKKARKDTSKKDHKTIGVQASLDAETCGVSPSNKKRKVECQENLKENIEDEDAMSDSELESDYDYVVGDDDSDYDPDNDYEDYSSDEDTQLESRKMEPFNDSSKPHREQKYIVFHDQLLVLLSMYHFCLSTEVNVSSVVIGSMLVAAMKCAHCKSFWEWCSQPKIKGCAAGDILLSGAILFSGNLPKKALCCLKVSALLVNLEDPYFDTKMIICILL